MDKIYDNVRVLEKKYKKSFRLNIFLSILLFTLTAGLVVLNLYAIRFNPAKAADQSVDIPGLGAQQLIFLVIIVITTIVSFVGGILHLFVFKKKAKQEADKIKRIKIEINKHVNAQGRYEDPITRDEILVTRVVEIISAN